MCIRDLVKLNLILAVWVFEQLLQVQIPKAQKNSQVKQLFALTGSAGVKAAHRHVGEIEPLSKVFLYNFDCGYFAKAKEDEIGFYSSFDNI